MPCTDPTSDIHFSTDDELYGNSTDGYDTVPRSRRTLLKSELQRRYIEQFSGGCGEGDHKMPPELIVTKASNQNNSASQQNSQNELNKKPFETDCLQVSFSEFPPLVGSSSRLSHSWHNLNASKSASSVKSQHSKNLYTVASNAESLQMKLSLKKKIWTGAAPEGSQSMDRTRPLSWGMPPIVKKKTVNKNCESLLNECSQKLVAWQQEFGSLLTRHKSLEPIKNKGLYNLIDPDGNQNKTNGKSKSYTSRVPFKFDKRETANSEPKIKKKRTPFMKVTENSQILNGVANLKTKATSSKGNRKSSNVSTNNIPLASAISSQTTTFSKSQKFKTGGIVATAVQPSKKSKRLRAINAIKPVNSNNLNTPISTTVLTATSNAHISPNYDNKEQNIARKVKTKLKKKK